MLRALINANRIYKLHKLINSSAIIFNYFVNHFHLLGEQYPPAQINFYKKSFCSHRSMDLSEIVAVLEEKLPPQLAESWDNTGLLLEPTSKKLISTLLFTNDLTEDVLDEAVSKKVDLIFSYHPPIFTPIKSLTSVNWKDRIILKCIENCIAVYSPHTACDAIKGGVNDWLIKCFDLSHSYPIKQSLEPQSKYSHCVEFCVPLNANISETLKSVANIEFSIKSSSENVQCIKVLMNKTSLVEIVEMLAAYKTASSITPITLSNLPLLSTGMGRVGRLKKVISLKDCIALMKKHVKVNHIRISQGRTHTLDTHISTIAVCAGSGSTVLKGVVADLYITGEMSHHDLLDANHKNISVILCEHSNSERGYLLELMNDLSSTLQGVNLIMSTSDKDPVSIL